MKKELNPIDRFNFLIGDWNLEYKIPQSTFSSEGEGEGRGEFKRILNEKFIVFNYTAKLKSSVNSAQGIFAWDEKSKLYRYWWFESSGNFLSATCNFINDETLCLNWHDSLLVQTFKKVSEDKAIIRMKYPLNENKYELILKVTLTRGIK